MYSYINTTEICFLNLTLHNKHYLMSINRYPWHHIFSAIYYSPVQQWLPNQLSSFGYFIHFQLLITNFPFSHKQKLGCSVLQATVHLSVSGLNNTDSTESHVTGDPEVGRFQVGGQAHWSHILHVKENKWRIFAFLKLLLAAVQSSYVEWGKRKQWWGKCHKSGARMGA